MKKTVTIGIPCYQNASHETLEDYMRFAYYLGRRYPEYDFFLAIIGKKEQYRARTLIIEESIRVNSDYILMLDDDHVIDCEVSSSPAAGFEFLRTLINHLEADPK